MLIRPFETIDKLSVIALWEECGLTRTWNNPNLDIERKLSVQPDWFFVGEEEGAIIATAMFGYDGHRGWINYLAVSPKHQKKGYARNLMLHGEKLLISVGCPKINLQVRDGNAIAKNFYEAIGYTQDEVISYGKRLIKDD
jgi:ribosomal protein S18 acetylase RimI-like enzyme